jgi:hypothetical protein
VVFPSWLYHWVHPYAGQTPRIAISFNAALAPATEVQVTPALQLIQNGVATGESGLNATRSFNPFQPPLAEEETSHVDCPRIP